MRCEELVVSPSAMLTQQVENWLRHAQLFEHVVATSSYLDATHILEETVTALYGDYRQQGEHKAVVGLHIVLIEDNPTRTAMVFQQDYHQMVELTETSPDALTRGGIKAFNTYSWRWKRIFEGSIWRQTIRKLPNDEYCAPLKLWAGRGSNGGYESSKPPEFSAVSRCQSG